MARASNVALVYSFDCQIFRHSLDGLAYFMHCFYANETSRIVYVSTEIEARLGCG